MNKVTGYFQVTFSLVLLSSLLKFPYNKAGSLSVVFHARTLSKRLGTG